MGERFSVSIIVPTLNSEQWIRDCLGSLTNLVFPKESVEILVVDNGSEDRTKDLAKEYKAKVLENNNRTISSSRNLGVKNAKGNILAFIDSDCLAPRNWLIEAMALLNGNNTGAVGAQYKLPKQTTWIERTWHLHIDKGDVAGEANWLPSCNMIVPKKYFTEVGGFREDLVTNEDIDFSRRIKATGLKIVADPQLSVVHLRNPKTIKQFFLKELWRGKGVLQNFLGNLPEVKLNKAIGYAFFTLACLVAMLTGFFYGAVGISWIPLVTASLAMLLPGLVLAADTAAKGNHWRYFFPLAYLYLVYGLARAVCLLDIRNWRKGASNAG
ncbi:glycosyltransferase [Candidatus Omnitrophota bacterium]